MTQEEINQREAIKKVFRDPAKVDSMSKAQVTAIYLRLREQGRL